MLMSKQSKPAGGPMRRGPRIPVKPKNTKETIKRIAGYMKEDKWILLIVFIAVIFSAGANIIGVSALQVVIDDFLHPMLLSNTTELTRGFLLVVETVNIIYLIGVASTYTFNRLMIGVSTRTLFKIRVDLFTKM